MRRRGERQGGRSRAVIVARIALAALTLVALLAVAAAAQTGGTPLGRTTVDQRIVKGPVLDPAKPGFFELQAGPGAPVRLREELGKAQAGREQRRTSLSYFAQLTDFQLADEESPARVEFADRGAASAWRPQEAFHPFAIDQGMRQLNALAKASPVRQGDGKRARMDSAVLTGDQADNQQYNETVWVRQLIEPGQQLNPGSGLSDYSSCDPAAQAVLSARNIEPNSYVGVQDYSDYFESGDYYDPNNPKFQWEDWPRYMGLMDRAQQPFTTTGLQVPSYVVNGNHDGLVQGNEDANQAFEEIATGCGKTYVSAATNLPVGSPDPNLLLGAGTSAFIPPDPDRHFVAKPEVRKIFSQGTQADKHGFAFVDPAEDQASGYSSWYYAWDPKPGLRFIAIDTVSEGGVVQESSEGNIDDPQFKWLERELKEATDADKLVVVFGHHPIRSLVAPVPDEAALPCTGRWDVNGNYNGLKDSHGHDPNPGCDADPRSSLPIREGPDLVALLHRFKHAIAYVPGHTHENRITPFPRQGGGGFWELNTSAVADWPQQNRLIDLMDNKDGTLSIWSLVVDHASSIGIPDATSSRAAVDQFSGSDLGALGRTFSYNDPQSSAKGAPQPFGAEGKPVDRNVELLIGDPREATAAQRRAASLRANAQGRAEDDDDDDATANPSGEVNASDVGGRSLAFTGLTLIPLVLAGVALLTAGMLVRRRMRD